MEQLPAEPGGGMAATVLRLLVFNFMGHRFGVDMEQVDEMLDPETARERGVVSVPLETLLPFRNTKIRYEHPKVLALRGRPACGVTIDRPEQVVEAPIAVLHRLPTLVRVLKKSDAVWCGFYLGEDIVLLVDVFKLPLAEAHTATAG
jgi:hypothetical protein